MKNNIWFFVYYDILFYLCKHKEKIGRYALK